MRKPPHRQITLIINRAEGVVVIYVNLCHILSHHFLALTTKRKSMIKLKPEQKGTFKSRIDIFTHFEIIQRDILREMTSEAESKLRSCELLEQSWVGKGHLGPVFAFKLCQFVSQTTFPTASQNHRLFMGKSREKGSKGMTSPSDGWLFSKYPKEGGGMSPMRVSFK